MNEIDELLAALDPSRQTVLTPKQVDAIWDDVSRRRITQVVEGHDDPDGEPERQLAIAHVRQRVLFASGAAVILLAAIGVWIGVGSTSAPRSGRSTTQDALVNDLRGARNVSIRPKSGVDVPTADLVYSVGPTLSSASPNLPVYDVSQSIDSEQLASLVAAASVPSGGTWMTAGGTTSYTVGATQNWTLSVSSSNGALSSFAYATSSDDQCTIEAGPAIIPFNPVDATAWSDSFISALGYSPSSFGPPEGNAGSCNSGPFWQFSRALDVDGLASTVQLSFGYASATGSLDNVYGPLVTLGPATQIPLTSPLSAAQDFSSQNNSSSPAPSGVPTVNVMLSSDTVQYDLYLQSSGDIDFVPTYVFSGTCSDANQIYCTVYLFPESAVGNNARTGATQNNDL